MPLCKNCGHDIPKSFMICENCSFDNRPTIICSNCNKDVKYGEQCPSCGKLIKTDMDEFVLTDEVFELELTEDGEMDVVGYQSVSSKFDIDNSNTPKALKTIWGWKETTDNLSKILKIHASGEFNIEVSRFLALKSGLICLKNQQVPADDKFKALDIIRVELQKMELLEWSSVHYQLHMLAIILSYFCEKIEKQKVDSRNIRRNSIKVLIEKQKEGYLSEYEIYFFMFNTVPELIANKELENAEIMLKSLKQSSYAERYREVINRYEFELKKLNREYNDAIQLGLKNLKERESEFLAKELVLLEMQGSFTDEIELEFESVKKIKTKLLALKEETVKDALKTGTEDFEISIKAVDSLVEQEEFLDAQMKLQKLVYELEYVEQADQIHIRGLANWKIASLYELEQDFEREYNALLVAYRDMLECKKYDFAVLVLLDLVLFLINNNPVKTRDKIKQGFELCKKHKLEELEKPLKYLEVYFDKYENEYKFSFILRILKKFEKPEEVVRFLLYHHNYRLYQPKTEEFEKTTSIIDSLTQLSILQFSGTQMNHPYVKLIKESYIQIVSEDERMKKLIFNLEKLSKSKISDNKMNLQFIDFVALNTLLHYPIITKKSASLESTTLPEFSSETEEPIKLPDDLNSYIKTMTNTIWGAIACSALFLIGGLLE